MVIDCETGKINFGLADALARHLGAECLAVGEVNAEALTGCGPSTGSGRGPRTAAQDAA